MTFIEFYQNLPSMVDPIILSLGSFQLRWYSMGYVIAFLLTTYLVKYRIKKGEVNFPIKPDHPDELILYIMLGVILGGRFGYVFFYQFDYYLAHPLEIILPFRFGETIKFVGISGLSYHGGMIACVLSVYWYCKKKGFPLIKLLDLYCSALPIGYTFGRLGNFMNGELYGRITDKPWGMYFLDANGVAFHQLRHPSQLYEAFVEGVLLFALLWLLRNKVKTGVITGLYFIGYGFGRSIVEFFRKPDDFFKDPGEELGTVFYMFSMGQVLSFLMIVWGIGMIVYYLKKAKAQKLENTN